MWKLIIASSVQAACEPPAPARPVEGEVEDPPPPGGARRQPPGGLDPPDLPLAEQVVDRRLVTAGLPLAGLPPGAGLHPVRDDVADLPQPALPQELLGAFHRTAGSRDQSSADLHGIVVPPHRGLPAPWQSGSASRAERVRRGWGSRSPPPIVRTYVRTIPT